MNFFKTLLEKYDIAAPERLIRFFESGEYKKYNGLYVGDLRGYTPNSRFEIQFDEEQMEMLFEEYYEFEDFELSKEDEKILFIPLSRIGEEPQFLAVKTTSNDCAVYMWEHEDGNFYEHSDSLDKFLANLYKVQEDENDE